MNQKQRVINVIIAGILMMAWYGGLHSAPSVGKAIEVFGKTEELKYMRQDKMAPLVADLPLYYQDGIITGPHSSTQLLVEDPASRIKAAFYVFEDSKFTLDKEVIEKTGKKIIVKHTQGSFSAVVKGIKKGEELRIVTPHATLGVRGTEFNIEAKEDKTIVTVGEGGGLWLLKKIEEEEQRWKQEVRLRAGKHEIINGNLVSSTPGIVPIEEVSPLQAQIDKLNPDGYKPCYECFTADADERQKTGERQ